MKTEIKHNSDQNCFEHNIEDKLSVIDYMLDGENLSLTSVRVPKALEGRGIAGELTQAALEWARENHYQVIPVCPYVKNWLQRHPEYRDILA